MCLDNQSTKVIIFVEDLTEVEREMRAEYMEVSDGRDTVDWLNKYKKHPKMVSNILAATGFYIHRYKMNAEERELVVETLSGCTELKTFSFTYSEGLKSMLDDLKKASPLPKVRLSVGLHVIALLTCS